MADLTLREMQMLHGIAAGKSNAVIARGLFLAEHTVKSHNKTLFAKLGARDRAHAVHLAHTQGLLGEAKDE